jgi:large subunit ribosomal protein L30
MSKTIQVTLVKSMIGRPEKHRRVLKGMGLTRVNKTVRLQDSPTIRGMIQKVTHLVETREASHETE